MSFKVRLLLGAAAPLVFALPAAAQVSIATTTTTPIATGTANAGAASDVTLTTAGSITVTNIDNSTAVTINSNNSVNNAGAISLPDADNATGIRILPGLTANLTSTGTISLLEDYTRTDTDSDTDLDGPLAIGTTRTGVLVDSGGTLTGNIGIGSGSITVEGNNSAGVSIRSALNGSYTQDGAISVTGSNSFGVDIREDVSGNVYLGSSTITTGEGSTAVRILGDVAGEFLVDGIIVSSGFTSNTITNYADPDFVLATDTPIDKRRDADDLLIGGPALAIRGDLARGLLINGNAVGGVDPTDTVKDVVQDFNENRTTGAISSFGSAPAVIVQAENGVAGSELRLGLVRETIRDTLDDDADTNFTEVIGVFDYSYGLMNRGTINASGLNIGIAATGLRIAGSADGTHRTIVDGGVFNGGAINGVAFEANAVGLNIGSGASTPQLFNTGSVTASVNTETNHDATAVRIDVGANLASVTNSGLMQAGVRGYDGDATAFADLSGTVTSFLNTSRIGSGFTDDDTTDTITSGLGRAVAIDLSHGVSNVTLTQSDTIDNARIFGDVLFGAGSDRFNLNSGQVLGDVEFGSGSDTFAISSAALEGDVSFAGSGATVSLSNNSTLLGDLSFGSAVGSLSLSGGSILNGAVTRGTSGSLGLTVNNSTLNNRATGTLALASLSFANSAKIGFVIDNARAASGAAIFNVAGVADIAANTVFTPIFEEFTNRPFTLRVLTAADLNLGGPAAAMLNASSPYLYDISLAEAAGGNALDLTMRVKTANELGLNDRQSSAYAAALDLFASDGDIASAYTVIANAAEFNAAFSDLLPGSDTAVMEVLATNATAAFGATAHRLDLIGDKPDAPGGAWLEEFGVYHDADTSTEGLGVSGGGFGVAGGIDLISSSSTVLGAFFALESVELEEDGRTGAPLNAAQTLLGGYGGWRSGPLAINGSASAGLVNFTSNRKIEVSGLVDNAKAEWNATSLNAGARATYAVPMGFLELKPYVAVDYMGLYQDGYSEAVTTNPAFGIETDSGESTLATASYGASLAADFGSDESFSLRPELTVGYRNILTYDSAPGAARFAGGTTAFVLEPGREPEDALVGGVGFNVSSEYLNMKVGYDTAIADGSTTHYGSITLRLAFW